MEQIGPTAYVLCVDPTPEQRAIVEGRADYLTDRLTPVDDTRYITLALTPLRQMKARTGPEDERGIAIIKAAYIAVLQPYPRWAIEAACAKLLASPTKFMPEAAEIAALASEMVAPYRAELHRLVTLMSAPVEPPPSAEEKALVAEAMARLKADLQHTASMHTGSVPGSIADAEVRLAREGLKRMKGGEEA